MNAMYTILIIDDEPIARETLAALLEKPVYRVRTASDGVEGMELAKEIMPDVILLDIMMPRMNGYDVCKRIRTDPVIGEVPIIMITALDDRDAKLDGLVAGADDFLSKPFDSLELEIRLHTLRQVNRYRRLLDDRKKLQETLAQLENEHALLRALSTKILEAQEDERRSVAIELHDEIGQLLTGLKLIFERGGSDVLAVDEARAITNELLHRLREISVNLRPADLDDFGLFAALAGLIKRFTKQTGIAIRHNINPLCDRRFDKIIETTIFRVAQEALTNIARHAQVYEATLALNVSADELQLRVSDAGNGFDTDNADIKASTGISGMTERVRLSGGRFMIHSAPGGGTVVHAAFDINPLK